MILSLEVIIFALWICGCDCPAYRAHFLYLILSLIGELYFYFQAYKEIILYYISEELN